MNWRPFQRADGTYDLWMAYVSLGWGEPSIRAVEFAATVETLSPRGGITSRQIAALILVQMKDRS